MLTFVVPDVHGRWTAVEMLLKKAVEQARLRGQDYQIVSIGDLCNGTEIDQDNDSECLLKGQDIFTKLIMGNHESGYIFPNMGFGGYYEAPHVASMYRRLFHQGFVVPCLRLGNTLLSHAGVHAYFDFEDAEDAEAAIQDVWENYNRYRDDMTEKFCFTVDRQGIEIPKALLLDGVTKTRKGSSPIGGLIWADWSEPKNIRFSQVMGHTPIKQGPITTTYEGTGVFHLNIDAGAKGGLNPWGVWLDSDGRILEFVTI